MDSILTPEIFLQICSFMSQQDLLSLQLVNKRCNALSLSALYRTVQVHEGNAVRLKDTLQAYGPAGNRLLKRVLVVRHHRAPLSDWSSIESTILPLLEPAFSSSITTLSLRWRDQPAISDTRFWTLLKAMPLIESFTLTTAFGGLRGTDLIPCLANWAGRLHHLTLCGLFATSSCPITDVPSLLYLKTLDLDQFGLPSRIFGRLFGQSDRLEDVRLFLGAPNLPSDHSVLNVIKNAGSSIKRLELCKPWAETDDKTWGLEAVCACPNLQVLMLHGQIFTPALFDIPHLRALTELDLQWYSVITFEHAAAWLRTLKEPRLARLALMCQCYDGGIGQLGLVDIIEVAIAKGIKRRSLGCVFGCVVCCRRNRSLTGPSVPGNRPWLLRCDGGAIAL